MLKWTVSGIAALTFATVAFAAPSDPQQALYCKMGTIDGGSTQTPDELAEAINYEIGQAGSLVMIKMRDQHGAVTTGQIRVGKISAPSVTMTAGANGAVASICVTIYADGSN